MKNLSHETLKEAGMRVTNQRSLIMNIIRQGHFDAEEIHRRARQKDPHLSLSTVYRSLQTFKKLGIIEELHFDETHHRYEVKPATEHHHLVCLGCGKVIEFQHSLARYLKKNVAEAKDFAITETEIRIAGYCSECRNKKT